MVVEMKRCVVCGDPLCLIWTDRHGIAACGTCEMDYSVAGFNGAKETTARIRPDLLEAVRAYWVALGTKLPFRLMNIFGLTRAEAELAATRSATMKGWFFEHHPDEAAEMWPRSVE